VRGCLMAMFDRFQLYVGAALVLITGVLLIVARY
jgi:hypothetical protein